MTDGERVEKLTDARDKCAEVFEKEATDDYPDNGNLSTLTDAILKMNTGIENIKRRMPE